MKFRELFIIIFLLFLNFQNSDSLSAKEKINSNQSTLLKKISVINKNFFKSQRKFTQISLNNKIKRKKTGFIDIKKESIKIVYDDKKSEIIFDNSNYITYNNKKLNSTKRYKNQNPLFPLILNSEFEKLERKNNVKIVELKEKDQKIILKILIADFKESSFEKSDSKKKTYTIQFICNECSILEVIIFFSEKEYIQMFFS